MCLEKQLFLLQNLTVFDIMYNVSVWADKTIQDYFKAFYILFEIDFEIDKD